MSPFGKVGVLGQAAPLSQSANQAHGGHHLSREGLAEVSTTARESLYEYAWDSTPLFGGLSCPGFSIQGLFS